MKIKNFLVAGTVGLGLAVPLAALPMDSASAGQPIISNDERSYYRINTYSDSKCRKDRRIISPGFGSAFYSGRGSYKVNAVSYVRVPGGAEKKVAKNKCYDIGNQPRYIVRNVK